MSHIAYSQPQALVETEWLAAHLHDPLLRAVESNEDVLPYAIGHIC
jgi:thiosulfate/3-mercaptopyruvate sulfurtransferase